jgi:hypothetical protein
MLGGESEGCLASTLNSSAWKDFKILLTDVETELKNFFKA